MVDKSIPHIHIRYVRTDGFVRAYRIWTYWTTTTGAILDNPEIVLEDIHISDGTFNNYKMHLLFGSK